METDNGILILLIIHTYIHIYINTHRYIAHIYAVILVKTSY